MLLRLSIPTRYGRGEQEIGMTVPPKPPSNGRSGDGSRDNAIGGGIRSPYSDLPPYINHKSLELAVTRFLQTRLR